METKELTTTEKLDVMLNEETAKRQLINKYIEANLVKDVDYGTITIMGKESKPSLFKPGSEKMCSLFHLTPKFSQDLETWEMLGKKPGIICFKCELVNDRLVVIGEGRGTATTAMEKDFDTNKQVKIAEKRAQIDAVLRAFSLSERFTQDVEDMPQEIRVTPEKALDMTPRYPSEPDEATLKQKEAICKISAHTGKPINFDDLKGWSKKQASEYISTRGNGGYYAAKRSITERSYSEHTTPH